MSAAIKPRLEEGLRRLRLPTFRQNYHPHASLAAREGWPYDQYLLGLCELELSEREQRRIVRLRRRSRRLIDPACPKVWIGNCAHFSRETFWIAGKTS